MNPSGGLMAKRDVNTVKISNDTWSRLKLISAVTGEKMNDIVASILDPEVIKRHKKALDQLAKKQREDDE